VPNRSRMPETSNHRRQQVSTSSAPCVNLCPNYTVWAGSCQQRGLWCGWHCAGLRPQQIFSAALSQAGSCSNRLRPGGGSQGASMVERMLGMWLHPVDSSTTRLAATIDLMLDPFCDVDTIDQGQG
jgi:hypothetical protein